MNEILKLITRPSRFLKPGRSLLLLMLLCFHTLAFADLNTGLVAYWSFDDCTAKDNIGSTNGITNNTTCVQGKSNKALSFNGTNSFVDLQYRDQFVVNNQSTPITISAWIMTNSADSVNRMDIFSDNSCSGYYEFGLLSGKPSLLLRTTDWGGVVLTADSSKNLADGKLHHITGIIDRQNVTLYADGVQVAQQTFSISRLYWCGQTHGYSGGSISGTGFKLNSTNTPEWGLFSGVIDELRIYNRALTAAEVGALYQQGTTPTVNFVIPDENELTLGSPILFSVKGENLPNGMVFELNDCLYPREVGVNSSTDRLFQCTPSGTEGEKVGKISYNGVLLKNFTAFSARDVSLISEWNFNDCKAADNSGQGVNGTFIGAPKCSATAKTGKSILFEKKSQFINMNHIVPQAGLTFIAWVNPDTLSAGIADIFKAFPSDNVFAINNRLYFKGNKLCQQFKGVESCSNIVFPQRQVINNYWQPGYFVQVAYVVAKGKANLYINGNLVSSIAVTASDTILSDTISIGGFKGRIDDVKLFKQALTASEIKGIFDAQLNLDMNKPICDYASSIFMKNWQKMLVKTQPSCAMVANYATWDREIRLDVNNASSTWSAKLNGLDAANTFYNKKIDQVDATVTFFNEIMDADLHKALKSEYSVNIFKPKGILNSVANGSLIFDDSKIKGKYLNKVIMEKSFGAVIKKTDASLCKAVFSNDTATLDACNNQLGKLFGCGYGLALTGVQGVKSCVAGGLTSLATAVLNWFSAFEANSIADRIRDYSLITEYLNAIYERGETATDLSKTALFYGVVPANATIANIVIAIANSHGYTSSDYDVGFVESQIIENKANTAAVVNSNTTLMQDSRILLRTPVL